MKEQYDKKKTRKKGRKGEGRKERKKSGQKKESVETKQYDIATLLDLFCIRHLLLSIGLVLKCGYCTQLESHDRTLKLHTDKSVCNVLHKIKKILAIKIFICIKMFPTRFCCFKKNKACLYFHPDLFSNL